MMSNRPKNPANARNKNVLIIGGSGSGKTRFWLKPNDYGIPTTLDVFDYYSWLMQQYYGYSH